MAIFDFLNSEQTGTQDITTTIDPQVKQAYLANLNFADTVASRPYEQYEGPRIAGFTGDQQQAFSQIQGLQNQYQPYLNQAGSTYQSGMNFSPAMVNYNPATAQGYSATQSSFNPLGSAQTFGGSAVNRGSIRDIFAGSFLNGNIGAYQNPYTSQVIDQTMQDLNRQKMIDQQGLNAQAARSGAFGGSRQAVAQQEMNRNYADQFARTSAQLRNQGFDTAANLMQSDLNRGFQAQQANQGMDANIASQNAGFAQQAGLANQAAGNQFALQNFMSGLQNNQFNAANQTAANQFGASSANQFALQNAASNLASQQFNSQQGLAGMQSNLAAANQFAGLGSLGQQLGLNATNALNQIGAQQQAQTQRSYDLANQDFQNQFNYPLQQLAIRQGALGAQIPNAGQTQSTPLYQNQLGNLLGLGMGINQLFGGTGGTTGTTPTGSFLSGLGSSLLSGGSQLFDSGVNYFSGLLGGGGGTTDYFNGGIDSADYFGGFDV